MQHRLVYVSTVSVGAAIDLGRSVQDILIQSVRNNRRDGITGFLLCDGLTFAQALEGPEEAVETCFRRIEADVRHNHPVVRSRTSAASRAFASWSMCGLRLSPQDDALLGPRDIGFDLRTAQPDALWQILVSAAARYSAYLDVAHTRLLADVESRSA